MDLEIITLSNISQKEDRYHMMPLMCGILKSDINEFIYKIDPQK